MSNTHDGGPAFPTTKRIGLEPYTRESDVAVHGMTLRDYFAAKALPTLVAEFMKIDSAWHDYSDVSESAYLIADAMLRARSAQSPAEKMREHLDEFGK